MMPASSQQSPTSGTRSASLSHSPQRMRTGSIHGRCSSCRPSSALRRALEQLVLAPDDGQVALGAHVERQRQAPVALARDAPVAHVAEPVLHALAVVRGRPLDGAVGLDHRLAHLVRRDEPLVDDAEDQLGAAAPADRVAVRVGLLAEQPAVAAEVVDDPLGGLVRVHAVQPAVVVVERAGVVDRRQHGQAVAHAELEVLGAAARRDVDDARALVERDVVPADHAMLDVLLHGQVVEAGRVRPADELGAGERRLRPWRATPKRASTRSAATM